MDFAEFEARAHAIFREIPPEYREGVDGLEVERSTMEHPTLPEVYTLGECRSEYYPSEFGGAGEVRSMVVVFYGSFLELARKHEGDWDWEGELWETITHEVRHHLESLASDDALEAMDYAEDQNFARRDGHSFDPFFYRSAPPVAQSAYEVDGDVFLEIEISREDLEQPGLLRFEWQGRSWRTPRPERLGDVHFIALPQVLREPMLFHLVLIRRRGAWEWVTGLLSRAELEIVQSESTARPA